MFAATTLVRDSGIFSPVAICLPLPATIPPDLCSFPPLPLHLSAFSHPCFPFPAAPLGENSKPGQRIQGTPSIESLFVKLKGRLSAKDLAET